MAPVVPFWAVVVSKVIATATEVVDGTDEMVGATMVVGTEVVDREAEAVEAALDPLRLVALTV